MCITRVGWLYDAGYYLSVLKRHWLGGRNGEVRFEGLDGRLGSTVFRSRSPVLEYEYTPSRLLRGVES